MFYSFANIFLSYQTDCKTVNGDESGLKLAVQEGHAKVVMQLLEMAALSV